MAHSRARGLAFVAILIAAVGAGLAAQAPDRPPLDPAALVAQLQASATSWNNGDLDGFIAPYAAESRYMTSEGPIGRDAMKARYAGKYFGAGKKPRPLRFEQAEVRALGDDHALMTGRYILGGDGQPDQSGWFTLVWVRTPAGWRILHDHSS